MTTATVVFKDTFTESGSDVALTAHVPDIGTGWNFTGSASVNVIAASNYALAVGNNNGNRVTFDGDVGTRDMFVQGTFWVPGGDPVTTGIFYGPGARAPNATTSCDKYFNYDYALAGGSYNIGGDQFVDTAPNGSAMVMRLECVGDVLTGFSDGVEKVSNTGVTATGQFAGVLLGIFAGTLAYAPACDDYTVEVYEAPKRISLTPAIIRKPWTKQPPVGTKIDWRNPIARKLAFLWSGPHTGGSYGVDLISGFKGLATGVGDAITTGISSRGHIAGQIEDGGAVPILDFDGAPSFDCSSDGYSWFVIQRLTDSSYTWRTSLALYNGTGFADADIIAMAYPITDTAGRAHLYTAGGFVNWDINVPWTNNDGEWHTWGVSTPWGTTGTRGFFDGKYIASTFDNLGSAAETVDAVQLLSNETWAAEGLGGDLLLAAVFKERLSDAEQVSLAENPWQIFEPRKIFVPPTPKKQRLVVL